MDKLINANITQSMSENKATFFQKLKEAGGWNQEYMYIHYYHSGCSNRKCFYSDQYLRTGWYTTFATRDEYFLWAISPNFLNNFRKKTIKDYHESVSPPHYDFRNFDFSYIESSNG